MTCSSTERTLARSATQTSRSFADDPWYSSASGEMPRTSASGPSTARITSAIEISSAGRASRYPPAWPATALHDPGAAQVAQDVLEEVDRDPLRLGDLLGGDHVARGGELDGRPDGVVGFRSRTHGTIILPHVTGVLTGGCLCGGVRYEVTEPPVKATYCHCTRCQRRTGTAASAQARSSPDRCGSWKAKTSCGRGSPRDGFAKCFCSRCGGALWSVDAGGEVWSVRLGTFDSDPGVRPSHRQYVAYAAAWEPIPDDGLPRYPEAAP